MDHRMNIFGKGQALEDDRTSTGAVCIAGQRNGSSYGRAWLFVGDKTTPCPACGQPGIIIEGESRWSRQGIPMAVDGSRVSCGCPPGSNYILAPLGIKVVRAASDARQPTARPASTLAPNALEQPGRSNPAMSAMPGVQEPGFHIVRRSTSFPQLVLNLFDQPETAPVERLKQLNPTFAQGFKAGEIFVIGDPANGFACTLEEAQLMAAAEQARHALADLSPEEANFMMRHQAEIAGLMSDVSLSMGVVQAMTARALSELEETLRTIETLYQQQFLKHGNLKSAELFSERRKLLTKLDAQLQVTFLNKHMQLGDHASLRRSLGVSSKSLVHHWRKAGVPGPIPGYSTHLDKLAKLSKYLEAGGRAGIVMGGVSSAMKIHEVCMAGETEPCKKVAFTETGSFAGGLAGGMLGAAGGKVIVSAVCLGLGPVGTVTCGVIVIGAGALAGSWAGMEGGDLAGEVIYETIKP